MSPPKGKQDKRVSRSSIILPTAAAGTAVSLAKAAGMEPPITARLNGEVWVLSLEAAAIAAGALGKIGGAASLKALEQALGTAPESLRAVLGEACVTVADGFLVQDKREEAAAAFDRIRASGLLPKRIVAAGFRGAVLARQAAGIPLLLDQLKSDDRDMRRMAFRLARELPGAEATRALAGELSKLPADGQVQLLQALGGVFVAVEPDRKRAAPRLALEDAGTLPRQLAIRAGEGGNVMRVDFRL
jgi:hypothetical protein